MASEERSTIYAVAQRAGVSIATVSRVMRGTATVSPRTRDLVIEAAAALQYVPSAAASQLASHRQAALGLVLPHIDGAYYSDLIVGFEQEAGRLDHSVSLVLANPRADATRAVRHLAERVSGLAFMAHSSAGDQLIRDLAGPRRVLTAARSAIAGVPSLRVASRDNARLLTDHLLATGRRTLFFLGTAEPGSDIEERQQGFLQAHQDHGVAVGGTRDCTLDEAGGRRAVADVLTEHPGVDGFVCGNDLVALSVLTTLHATGRTVPQDCAVVGWDDILTARHVIPALTTVRQPVRELGARAAALLVQPEGIDEEVLASDVVHRGTCCTDDGSPTEISPSGKEGRTPHPGGADRDSDAEEQR